jgi:hypothetical protein
VPWGWVLWLRIASQGCVWTHATAIQGAVDTGACLAAGLHEACMAVQVLNSLGTRRYCAASFLKIERPIDALFDSATTLRDGWIVLSKSNTTELLPS